VNGASKPSTGLMPAAVCGRRGSAVLPVLGGAACRNRAPIAAIRDVRAGQLHAPRRRHLHSIAWCGFDPVRQTRGGRPPSVRRLRRRAKGGSAPETLAPILVRQSATSGEWSGSQAAWAGDMGCRGPGSCSKAHNGCRSRALTFGKSEARALEPPALYPSHRLRRWWTFGAEFSKEAGIRTSDRRLQRAKKQAADTLASFIRASSGGYHTKSARACARPARRRGAWWSMMGGRGKAGRP